MTTKGRHLSAGLNADIEKAKAVYINVVETSPGWIPMTYGIRSLMFAATAHLAHDLNASIIRLISRGGSCDGGAFALLRPLVENYVNGLWLFYCATDAELGRFGDDKPLNKSLKTMMDDVDSKTGIQYFSEIRSNVKYLHSLTHGGAEQILRRLDASGRLTPNYSDEDKSSLLVRAAWTTSMHASLFCRISEGQNSPSAKQIDDKFKIVYQGFEPEVTPEGA